MYQQLSENMSRTTHEAAPVPLPDLSPLRIAFRVVSSDGMTIPMHNAEPTKKTSRRQAKDRKAGGRTLRGFSVSAATIEMYSGPVMLVRVNQATALVMKRATHEKLA